MTHPPQISTACSSATRYKHISSILYFKKSPILLSFKEKGKEMNGGHGGGVGVVVMVRGSGGEGKHIISDHVPSSFPESGLYSILLIS